MTRRILFRWSLCAGLLSLTQCNRDPTPRFEVHSPRADAPNQADTPRTVDQAAIQEIHAEFQSEFSAAIKRSPSEARDLLAQANAEIERLRPSGTAAAEALDGLKDTAAYFRRFLAAQEAEIDALAETVRGDPNDLESLLVYGIKFQVLDGQRYQSESIAEADARLDRVRELLESTRARTTDERIKAECESLVIHIERTLKPRRRKAEEQLNLVGTTAVLPSAEHGSWLDGTSADAVELRGRVVLFDFWALWCAPCIAGLPKVHDWQERYGKGGLVVVAAIQQEDDSDRETQITRIQELFQSQGIRLPCFLDDGTLFEANGVEKIPHYTLVDRKGKIRLVRTGNSAPSDLEAEIEALLAE